MQKNIVITGANRGIGLSLTKYYLQQGCTVYALCRMASSELKATQASIVEHIDVGKNSVADRLTEFFSEIDIDVLINNAGILKNEALGQINTNSLREQFEVNAIGPLKITEALMGSFAPQAKVAMITSRMGSIADNSSGGRYGYRMSKAALNIAAVSLAHDLRPSGIAVAVIHPGLVGTEMIGGIGDITPDQAATRIAQRIESLTLNNSGTFWHANGEVLPW